MSIVKLLAGAFTVVIGLALVFGWDLGLDLTESLGAMGVGLAVEVAPAPLP